MDMTNPILKHGLVSIKSYLRGPFHQFLQFSFSVLIKEQVSPGFSFLKRELRLRDRVMQIRIFLNFTQKKRNIFGLYSLFIFTEIYILYYLMISKVIVVKYIIYFEV